MEREVERIAADGLPGHDFPRHEHAFQGLALQDHAIHGAASHEPARSRAEAGLTAATADFGDLAARLEEGAEPLVLVGGARRFPAFQRWNTTYLDERFGDVQVGFKVSTSNVHPDFRQAHNAQRFARDRATLREFLRRVTSGEPGERSRFLFTGDEECLWRRREGRESVHSALGALLEDVALPCVIPQARLWTVWPWFSGRGVRTWLHYDNNGCHNLNAQITGRKRCVLYPPDELRRLHPYLLGAGNPAHNCSAIDVDAPQPTHAAALAAARVFRAEVEAGDLLFIPAWWFHSFEHLGELNSNVNFWWRPQRPSWNPVAARQALLDAAARAGLGELTPELSRALSALDAAAVARTDL